MQLNWQISSRDEDGIKELFEAICKSGSAKKLGLLLDKVMDARMKVNQDTFHNFTLNSRKIRTIQEFTKQDEELVKIYTMLLENPLKTSSPIQKLLLHFRECVTHLFDEHVLSLNEAINRKDR